MFYDRDDSLLPFNINIWDPFEHNLPNNRSINSCETTLSMNDLGNFEGITGFNKKGAPELIIALCDITMEKKEATVVKSNNNNVWSMSSWSSFLKDNPHPKIIENSLGFNVAYIDMNIDFIIENKTNEDIALKFAIQNPYMDSMNWLWFNNLDEKDFRWKIDIGMLSPLPPNNEYIDLTGREFVLQKNSKRKINWKFSSETYFFNDEGIKATGFGGYDKYKKITEMPQGTFLFRIESENCDLILPLRLR